jgi:oligosaccharyltransferase complex subunit beta
MRWLLSFLLLGFLAVVHAASASGNKLLVVLEELADKSKYSKYFGDLEGILSGNINLIGWGL